MKRRLVNGALLLLAGASLWGALRELDVRMLGDALRRAQPAYILLAVVLLCSSYLARSLRWHYLFPREVRARGLRHTTGILAIAAVINDFTPARAGDLVRIALMGRHNQVEAAGTLATLFVERVLDGFALGLVGLLALQTLAGEQVGWLRQLCLLFSALFVVLVALAFGQRTAQRVLERCVRVLPARWTGAALSIGSSALRYLGTLASPLAMARALLLTLLVWSVEAVIYGLVARAFATELSAPLLGGLLSVANFASLAPTPGGLGAVEYAGTAVLTAGGIAAEPAFIVVAVRHALQYALGLGFGSWFAARLGFAMRALRDEPVATPEA